MSSILDEILESTENLLKERKSKNSEQLLRRHARGMPAPRNFAEALTAEQENGENNIIAELKKASPSKGLIRQNFPVVELARELETGGAAALSVLTEPNFFQGSLRNLQLAADNVNIPVLRKDFIIDTFQILEARVFGASAVLLITSALEKSRLEQLIQTTESFQMNALVEVHTKEELDAALECNAKIVGVNSRDLSNFETDLKTTINLISEIPNGIVKVAESGINNADDMELIRKSGVDAVLVGECLMKSSSPGKKITQLVGSRK